MFAPLTIEICKPHPVRTHWITVTIDRHPNFGGGTVDADLPDTPAHRAIYAGRIQRYWSQSVNIDAVDDRGL